MPNLATWISAVLLFAYPISASSKENGESDSIWFGKNPEPSKVNCESRGGLNSAKASLAVAMAAELGRLEPAVDLAVSGDAVTLSSLGLAQCTRGCPRTLAILGRQFRTGDPTLRDPASFRRELRESFHRHLEMSSPMLGERFGAETPSHHLTLVAGPVRLDPNSCGPHYVFQVDYPNGKSASTLDAASLEKALCFFGEGNCGNNPYLGFRLTSVGCPMGRTCIAIDPTDGDNSSTSTTTTGAAPQYPFDRVWDPSNAILASQCVVPEGNRILLGQMQSRCAEVPQSCGFLYCFPIGAPTVFMISTVYRFDDVFVEYALNAYYGAYEYWDGSDWIHTVVTLHSACDRSNSDCLWLYDANRMLRSFSDTDLAINAWGGAGQDVALVLTRWCTPSNPDCTWTYVNGQFQNDGNPSLKFAAPNGPYDGSQISLSSDQSELWMLR